MNLHTFSIRETTYKTKKQFSLYIKQYKHMENMLNILLAHTYTIAYSDTGTLQDKTLFSLLLNPIIMKAVLSNNTGGSATAAQIKYLKDHFLNSSHPQHNLFKELVHFSATYLNDKNCSMILRRLKKDWQNYFLLKKSDVNASYPKPKKLTKLYNYSVPLERGKFSLKKKGYLGITLGKKMQYTYIGKDCQYLNTKQINSITVCMRHGEIYYQFNYIPLQIPLQIPHQRSSSKSDSALVENRVTNQIYAGLDIGIKNLFSLYTTAPNSESFILSGAELVSYNCFFNKTLATLNKFISLEKQIVNNYKTTHHLRELEKARDRLYETRVRKFDTVLHQISKQLVNYLKYSEVTDLVISKNLSFCKTTGKIKQRKKEKQKFYQIPFGRLLNLVEEKCMAEGIRVLCIDETYTSKVSCLSGSVVEIQRKKKEDSEYHPEANELSGVRVKRGLYQDRSGLVINADINGAVNHIKVGLNLSEIELSFKKKLCNPVKVKNIHELTRVVNSYINKILV